MRKWLIACGAFSLVLAGGLVALVAPRHCPVNRAAFERIEEGMTVERVEAVLGLPPGEYQTRPPGPHCVSPDITRVGEEMDLFGPSPDGIWMWDGDTGSIRVYYRLTPAGHRVVLSAEFWEVPLYSPGLVELARWRLGKLGEALLPERADAREDLGD